MPRPYAKTTYDGRTVDWLTRAALEDTARRLGYDLTLHQGSYNAGGVTASAGTHDGGGAVDLAPWDHERKVLELRRTGFMAHYRPELWRDGRRVWGAHIHAGLLGNRKASAGLRAQFAEYLDGGDGLAGDGRDTGPRQFVANRYRWRRGTRRIRRAHRLLERANLLLSVGIRGYAVGKSRRALREAAKQLPR
jgi:hypothetical protein